jgi:hypothetical protein
MPESLADQIIQKIDEVATLYHRLILVVAPSGGGKTRALREVSQRTGFPYLNLNLELSRQLLDMTERQRLMRVSRMPGDMVNAQAAPAVLLGSS